MRRILIVALLALGGTFALSGVAAADIEDIRHVEADEQVFGDASSVEVTGTIRCAATLEYGLWVGVNQDADGNGATDQAFIADSHYDSSDASSDQPVEGVGAYGPNFDPPVGVSDDSPCSQSLSSWDVVVQQNRDSDDFKTGDGVNNLGVTVIAGTSAENGSRGPGPFIGDMAGFFDDDFDFERTR